MAGAQFCPHLRERPKIPMRAHAVPLFSKDSTSIRNLAHLETHNCGKLATPIRANGTPQQYAVTVEPTSPVAAEKAERKPGAEAPQEANSKGPPTTEEASADTEHDIRDNDSTKANVGAAGDKPRGDEPARGLERYIK